MLTFAFLSHFLPFLSPSPKPLPPRIIPDFRFSWAILGLINSLRKTFGSLTIVSGTNKDIALPHVSYDRCSQ